MPASDKRLHKQIQKINRQMGKAIHDFSMIREGDRILVAFSGGKDSATLIDFLISFQKKAPVRFDLLAVHVDQGFAPQPTQPSAGLASSVASAASTPVSAIESILRESGIRYRIEREDIASIVRAKAALQGEIPCALCGKLRRGILYRVAEETGCNVLALGHHADDLIETFLMNSFFSGKLGSMSPHYESENYGLRVIRPLALVYERTIIEYNQLLNRTFSTCEFCESEAGFKRKWAKQLVQSLEHEVPEVRQSMLAAIGNVHEEELADTRLWKDRGLSRPG